MKFRFSTPVIICAAYFALHNLAHLSASFFEVAPGISIWYPPAGLALALLVLLGPRYAPVVLGTNIFAAIFSSGITTWWAPLLFPTLITANYTGAAWLIRRYSGSCLFPDTKRGSIVFAVTALSAPACIALIGTSLLQVMGIGNSDLFIHSAFNWWVGDVSGILTVVPVILVIVGPWLIRKEIPSLSFARDRRLLGIIILQFLCLLGGLGLVFALEPLRSYNAFYLCFLPLIWISLRHGLKGATLATLAITMGGLIGMHFLGTSHYLIFNFLLFELAAAAVGLGLGSAVTRRNQAEAETRRLLQVIEANTDFIVTTDRLGRMIYANEAFLQVLGIKDSRDLSTRSLMEHIPDRIAHSIQSRAIPSAITSGSWQGEVALMLPHERELPVLLVLLAHRDENQEALSLSFIMRDISPLRLAEIERIKGERKMLQTQKLESLGVLAGGIAHDFNNLLTVMLGNASLARLDLPSESSINTALAQIETAAASAAELCQQMLAYAGRSPLAFTQVDVSELIKDTTHLIQITLGKKHTLVLDLVNPAPLIQADSTQIRQIIMNLTLNASQALGDTEGRIVIRTSSRDFDADEIGADYSDTSLPTGSYLVLEVEDTGCGMPPEVLTRIFEPFFTTKFSGHGLGLAAVLGIVKCHNGAIRVVSQLGKGTTFSAIFPSIRAGAENSRPVRNAPAIQHWHGTGLVLVIDDEANVRNTIVNTVTSLGFTSLVASDGYEGIEIFRKHAANIRFVILDLTMPRMNGDEAFLALHAIAPEVPIILMSGFSEAQSLEHFVGAKPAAFIAKPFNHQMLNDCLRQLGAARPQG